MHGAHRSQCERWATPQRAADASQKSQEFIGSYLSSRPFFAVDVTLAMQQELVDKASGLSEDEQRTLRD
jgi:hypothetical protein